jgi:hypothetical protein
MTAGAIMGMLFMLPFELSGEMSDEAIKEIVKYFAVGGSLIFVFAMPFLKENEAKDTDNESRE